VSFALSPGLLASASLDRFTRIHSTPDLPTEPKKQQEKRGEILDKTFLSSIPTVIVAWDEAVDSTRIAPEEEGEGEGEDGEEDDGDDVWENMKNVEDDSDAEGERRKRKKKT
jgi:ribosome biogenesis protein NSA1